MANDKRMVYVTKVYMLYHVSTATITPKLPIAVFESEKEAIHAANQQEGYGYQKDWFIKEVPFFSYNDRGVVEVKPDEGKDSPEPAPVTVCVGDQIHVEGSAFLVESYSKYMSEPPAAYLKSVSELAEETNLGITK